MSGLDIEAIRARSHRVARVRASGTYDGPESRTVYHQSAADVPALLAEVERLRAALLEEQTVHAKTMDNFEAACEGWLEERTRLLDRYARLDAENDRLRKSLDEELCAAVIEARDEARSDVRDAADQIRQLRSDLATARRTIRELITP